MSEKFARNEVRSIANLAAGRVIHEQQRSVIDSDKKMAFPSADNWSSDQVPWLPRLVVKSDESTVAWPGRSG